MRQPLYRQIATQLLEQIENGQLGKGVKLPPEAELAKRYGVSRPTLREALGALERDGFIARVHGIGTFVRRPSPAIEAGLESFESYTETIRRKGYAAEDLVLDAVDDVLGAYAGEALGAPDAPVVTIDSLRFADGEPVIFCRDVLLPAYASRTTASEVLTARKGVESLLEYLWANLQCELSHAQLSVRAVPAPEHVARHLDLPRDSPVLYLTGTSFDVHGAAVYMSMNYFRTDHYAFTFARTWPRQSATEQTRRERSEGTMRRAQRDGTLGREKT